MTCVVDSSVWISAFQFDGTPLAALLLTSEEHKIAVCPQILREVRRVLTEKFKWSDARLDAVFAEFRAGWIHVETPGQLCGVCRDRNDDVIIECAVMAGADVIVTGDKDLLALRGYKSVRIVTPREFLDEFESRPGA